MLSLSCITILWKLAVIACSSRKSILIRKGKSTSTIDIFRLRYDWLGSVIRAL